MGSLFGKPAKSKTSNLAYPALSTALSPSLGLTGTAGNSLSTLLGLSPGGGVAQDSAFENFRDNSGYDFQMGEGIKAIEGSQAAKGLLNSGSTLKALNTFGQGMANQSLGSYMDNIFKLGNLGLGAGGILAGAGSTSTSTGGKPGIGSLLGAGLSGWATGGFKGV